MGQKTVVHFEEAYDGRRIMLLVLYQKGELRADVLRLLKAARAEGLYILAVNTLQLKESATLEGLVDCYIERPNFGRDFGSYKTGFMHVFDKGWDKDCPRLLMLNDSVYFSSERLAQFLSDMMTSPVEALGSTENFDIEHHLGSFCIAFGVTILRHPAFQAYWKSYRMSDVRPRVIKGGEIKLSKVAKRCVSSPSEFAALYSASKYISIIHKSDELISYSIRNLRSSKIFSWKQASLQDVAEEYQKRVGVRLDVPSKKSGGLGLRNSTKLDIAPATMSKNLPEYATTFADLHRLFQKTFGREDIDAGVLRDILVNDLSESFLAGSQIHQNSSILLQLGLPIIKLDGLYRGIFSVEDMIRLVNMLDESEGKELQDLLVARPYGGRYLTGWRKAAFKSGLL